MVELEPYGFKRRSPFQHAYGSSSCYAAILSLARTQVDQLRDPYLSRRARVTCARSKLSVRSKAQEGVSKCQSHGIWRQGTGSFVRESYANTCFNTHYALSSYALTCAVPKVAAREVLARLGAVLKRRAAGPPSLAEDVSSFCFGATC